MPTANNALINRTPILENLDGEFTKHELVARSSRRMFASANDEAKAKKKFHVLWFRCSVTGRCRQYGLVAAGGWVFAELRGVPVIEIDEIIGELIAHRKREQSFLEGAQHTWAEQWAEYYTQLSKLEHKASRAINAGLMS